MNFRRLLSFFMTLVLILALFSGCKGKNNPTLEEDPKDIEETKVVFSESIEKTEKVGLYELGTEITKNTSNIKIVAGDETAYLCSFEENALSVTHFSVFENKVLTTTTLNGTDWNYGVLMKDEFYAVELSTATLYVYERTGGKKSEIKLVEGALSFAFLERSGKNIIYKKADSNIIYKYNLSSKETTNTKESFDIKGNPSYDENAVYIKCSDSKSYSIAFNDLKVTKTRTETFREFLGPVGVATEKNYFTIAFLDTGKEKIMIEKRNADEKPLYANETRLITKTNDFFRCYTLSSGIITEEIGSEDETVIDAQFLGDDYIFAAIKKDDSSENVYRLLKMSEDEKTSGVVYNRLFDSTIYSTTFNQDGKNNADTDRIAFDYGVRFLYGKMGSDFKSDFSYKIASEEDALAKLAMAEKILSIVPTELLKEANDNREIWVYLCKGLDTKGVDYTKNAGLTKIYNHNVIFIDVGTDDETFAELFCHQIAHILDNYMPESVLAPFSELTPSEYKKSGNDKYTQQSSDEEIWFYNKDCKISDKEDRTITLGEMFNAIINYTPTEKFLAKEVKAKADFLVKAIVKSFDSCKDSDGAPLNVYYTN